MWFLVSSHPSGYEDNSFQYKYVRSVYDGMLMLVGENINPQNENERTFIMLIMFIAA
jgi:hypothetical protein